LTPLSILLILISALLHSSWNFFTKRGNWPLEFFFWVFLWGSLIYLPFFFGFGHFPALLLQLSVRAWVLPLLSALVQTFYFICLFKAYQLADLSLVYPISRSAPFFTQIWAIWFIGEVLSIQGIIGIGLVMAGIFLISMREFQLGSLVSSFHFSPRPYLLAFSSAVAGSIYSVIDKVSVQILHPLFFIWFINLWMCLATGIYLLFRKETSFRKVWREWKKDIFIIALLQNGGYLLILMALQTSKVSYVVAFRQVAALFGAGMGIFFLKESYWKTRLTGGLILTSGLVLIGMA